MKYQKEKKKNREGRSSLIGFCFILLLALAVIYYNPILVKAENTTEAQTEKVKVPSPKVLSKTLYTGYKSYTLKMKDTEKGAKVSYQSDHEAIAKVSSKGKITPISAGQATILVTIKQKKETYEAKVSITVKDPYYEVLSSTDGLHVGDTFVFQAKRYGMTSKVTWKLEDSTGKIAELKVPGKLNAYLTAKGEGTVTLIAKCRDVEKRFEVTMVEGSGEIYIVSPKVKPYKDRYMNYGSYNSNTKDYYVIRSYLERLDAAGGGTIVLKAGNYSITNTLCIPSNTQLRLFDGAKITKSDKTGTSALSATRSMFQLVSYTSAAKEGIYKGYNGEHDIKIIGEGSATMDMNFLNCATIVMAHNQNVVIRGITFLNMNTNHFIELDASKNVVIENNVFQGHQDSVNNTKEAINLDTPDKTTLGFSQYWTSYDGTANQDVVIRSNTFKDLECAVGTHKYTEGKQHKNIQVLGNTFVDCDLFAIRAMNWDSPIIMHNLIETIGEGYTNISAIVLNGVVNPKITENIFKNVESVLEAFHWKNSGNGSQYGKIMNQFSAGNIDEMKRNYISNVENDYFMIYNTYGEFMEDITTELIDPDYYLD